jgi:hypothetical protein
MMIVDLNQVSVVLVLGGKPILLFFLLLGEGGGCLRVLFYDVIVVAFHLGGLPALLVDDPLLLLVLLLLGLFVASVDESHDFLVLELVESQLLLLLLQDELLALEFVLEVFAFAFQRSDLLVALFLDFCSLVFKLFDFVLELGDDLLVDFLSVGLLLLELVLDLLHLLLLDDVGLVQLPDLLLLFVDGLDLLLGLLGELLELLLHPADLVRCFLVFIILKRLLLGLPDLFQRLLLLLQRLQLPLQMLELVFLLDYLIDVVFAI